MAPITALRARRVAVAFSGGRDSTALLHSTLRTARELGISVLALHVNHGLMPQADEWQRSLRARCTAWARRGAPLTLVCERIVERPASGDSVEAWARRVRYAALLRMAQAWGCDTVLLAQHRRDQAETFLLQALRGAGVAGIAAMPKMVRRDGINWLRPWIDQPRSAIEAYVERYRLAYIDDDSNAELRFARNRLRSKVWPGLLQAFPDAERTLGAAARWAQQAAQGLQELAAIDLAVIADGDAIVLELWQALSPARRSNALRAWLHRCGGRPAPAALVERLLAQWPAPASTTGEPRGGRIWAWGGDRLLASRGRLRMIPATSLDGAGPHADADEIDDAASGGAAVRRLLPIVAPGTYPIAGWRGQLVVERVASGGVPLARLAAAELRRRSGGETFQPAPDRPARCLKKQFQAADVPAWQRHGPLIFSGGQMLFVAGLGLDARCVARSGDDLVNLHWRSAASDR